MLFRSCVDVYNPKVIQASMGSFLRVMPIYMDLNAIVSNFKGQNLKIPMVYGAFMSGDSVFSIDNFHAGILVIGGEANGIRPELFAMIDRKITIPRFSEKAESLNAAVAASVIISQFKRINA